MRTNLELYVCTVEEYKRFIDHLPINDFKSITDDYSEADYIGIQVRLMLLRKYFSGGKKPPNVFFKRIAKEAESNFPTHSNRFQRLCERFDEIETQQLEHILSDGTKLNLYETIEDTVYGLYLHADESRIRNLEKTSEGIRFCCIRKYVVEIEKIVLELYAILVENGVTNKTLNLREQSPVIYLGDPTKNTQSINGSQYWKNIYGRDATDNDLQETAINLSKEDKEIFNMCMQFTLELLEKPIQAKKLRKYIHPMARSDWGDFSNAQTFYESIPNPGFSTLVRYNENRDTAYVRFFPKVEEPFIVDTPHVFDEVYEISLGKWFGKWKIYSFGHLDSIYTKNK